MTPRQKLVRNVRRCLADLGVAGVWKMSLADLVSESRFALRYHSQNMASDEVANLTAIIIGETSSHAAVQPFDLVGK